jgi:hypothetical protein
MVDVVVLLSVFGSMGVRMAGATFSLNTSFETTLPVMDTNASPVYA